MKHRQGVEPCRRRRLRRQSHLRFSLGVRPMHRLTTAIVFWCLCASYCLAADDLPLIIDHVASHRAPSSVASVPWDRYAGDLRPLPIGVFDSGIGGLTVLE